MIEFIVILITGLLIYNAFQIFKLKHDIKKLIQKTNEHDGNFFESNCYFNDNDKLITTLINNKKLVSIDILNNRTRLVKLETLLQNINKNIKTDE